MFINFANEELTSRIFCDKPCTDSNDVTNLISSDPLQRCKGFLVEHFVKPPVFIHLEFICSITINRITINCQVGIQKSSIIEVFTRQNNRSDKVIVAKKILKENENSVNFVLHGKQNNNSENVTFRLSKYLCNVNEVSIKILKTEGSTLAALGKIEVWGKPSKQVDKDIIKAVNEIWTKVNSFPTRKIEPNACISPKKPVFRYCRDIKIPQVDIPEEFIDPITCELFVIPMTLPSGKIVDASTLERFNKTEEKLGRLPSDPFTGCVFTESRHPVVATALKARLDKFLLDYSHIPSLKCVPRTIGRASLTDPLSSFRTQPQDISTPSSSKQCIKTVDELLESSLNGLPSFLEKPSVTTPMNECFHCNNQTVLFKLQCNDLICRSCLVSFKTKNITSCSKCAAYIDYTKVQRFHSV